MDACRSAPVTFVHAGVRGATAPGLTTWRGENRRARPSAGVDMNKRLLTSVLLVAITLIASGVAATAGQASEARLTVSDRTVLPGDVVTVDVSGADASGWLSGAATSFERRVHGEWRPMYQLVWIGGVTGPAVRPLHSPIEMVGVRGPVQAVIPAVAPGRYRLARSFGLGPQGGYKNATLTAVLTVKPCPAGTRAAFYEKDRTSTDPALKLGKPACRTT